MRFWDSAAVVPLVVPQDASGFAQREYTAEPALGDWCMTPVEVWSAVCRLRRDGLLDSPAVRTARRRLRALTGSWVEIDDVQGVRRRAQRLLETHPLRAADSLQIAAALLMVSDRPEGVPFLTFDTRLGEAAERAEREGFDVVGVTPG